MIEITVEGNTAEEVVRKAYEQMMAITTDGISEDQRHKAACIAIHKAMPQNLEAHLTLLEIMCAHDGGEPK